MMKHPKTIKAVQPEKYTEASVSEMEGTDLLDESDEATLLQTIAHALGRAYRRINSTVELIFSERGYL